MVMMEGNWIKLDPYFHEARANWPLVQDLWRKEIKWWCWSAEQLSLITLGEAGHVCVYTEFSPW